MLLHGEWVKFVPGNFDSHPIVINLNNKLDILWNNIIQIEDIVVRFSVHFHLINVSHKIKINRLEKYSAYNRKFLEKCIKCAIAGEGTKLPVKLVIFEMFR